MRIIKQKKEYTIDKDLILFDIETTGLSARTSYVYLIGFLHMNGEECELVQLFCEDFNDEKEMLRSFLEYITDRSVLVSFNGNTFDVPYLNAKFERHKLRSYIEASCQIDLYRVLNKYRKYFPVEDMKLTTIEKHAGFERTDIFSGGDLIDVYAELVGRLKLARITGKAEDTENANALTQTLLLHNSDDIEGLYYIYCKTKVTDLTNCDLNISTSLSEYELDIITKAAVFPVSFEYSTPESYVCNTASGTEFVYPVRSCTLKYFLPDYENYTYIIDKDVCMPTSIVSGVERSNRKKCTKKTAYIKKDGNFIPIPKSMTEYCADNHIKMFKSDYDDKQSFVEATQDEPFYRRLIALAL